MYPKLVVRAGIFRPFCVGPLFVPLFGRGWAIYDSTYYGYHSQRGTRAP